MKQTVTNTQITDKEFTINDIPAIIDDNQFYCFNPKTGTVRIGEIIGKSALRSETRYKLGHFEFKDYRTLSNDNPIVTFRINSLIKNVKAYKNYQDFIKEYNEHVISKLKKKKEQKTRYIVSTDTFMCRTTKAKYTPYSFKAFDSKDEATEYAMKGLKSIKTKLDKYIPTLKDMQKQLLAIQGNSIKDKSFDNLMATPKNVSEKDLLTKIVYKRYKILTWPEVDESYIVRLVKRITPELALLSDGTLLDKKECQANSFPMLIKLDSVDDAKDKLNAMLTERLANDIKYNLPHLEKLKEFVEKYTPFKRIYGMANVYFQEKYTKELIEDIQEALPKLKGD